MAVAGCLACVEACLASFSLLSRVAKAQAGGGDDRDCVALAARELGVRVGAGLEERLDTGSAAAGEGQRPASAEGAHVRGACAADGRR